MKMYEFEYLSEVLFKESNRRTNCFTSAIELKEGDAVIIEKKGRGIFLGRIIQVCNEGYETDYTYIGNAGKEVAAYLETIEKKERKKELKAKMEAKFKEIDKERKFEYYATLDIEFNELYEEYKSL